MIRTINGYQLSPECNVAIKGEERIEFTGQEVKALTIMLSKHEDESAKLKTVSAKELTDFVWGGRVVTDHSLRKLMSELRKKLGSKDVIKNIRGEGYQLIVEYKESAEKEELEQVKGELKNRNNFGYSIVALAVIALVVHIFFLFVSNESESTINYDIRAELQLESNNNIADYDAYRDEIYTTLYDDAHSRVVKYTNGVPHDIFQLEKYFAYRTFDIHQSGKTALQEVVGDQCRIRIFSKPFEDELDSLICQGSVSFAGMEWLNKDKLLITLDSENDIDQKPYIYNLSENEFSELHNADVTNLQKGKVWDYFVKHSPKGIFTLRVNEFHEVKLMYFEGDNRRSIYTFKYKPYSFALIERDIYLVNLANEIVKIGFDGEYIDGDIKMETITSNNLSKISYIQESNGGLYYLVGKGVELKLSAYQGSFERSLEKGVVDVNYVNGTLSLLGLADGGYVYEVYESGELQKRAYIYTDNALTHITIWNGLVVVGGSSGIFEFSEGVLNKLDTSKIGEIVSGEDCLIYETDKGVFSLDEKNNVHQVSSVGRDILLHNNTCHYVDDIDGYMKDVQGNSIAKINGHKRLISHQGKLSYWENVNYGAEVRDIDSDQLIAKLPKLVRNMRLVSSGEDFLYLDVSQQHTSLYKANIKEIK